MMSSTISEDSNEFVLPPDSPGSSVSTRLQEEYDELLRFAVVVPSFDPTCMPKSLQDIRGSFPETSNNQTQQTEDGDYNIEDECKLCISYFLKSCINLLCKSDFVMKWHLM